MMIQLLSVNHHAANSLKVDKEDLTDKVARFLNQPSALQRFSDLVHQELRVTHDDGMCHLDAGQNLSEFLKDVSRMLTHVQQAERCQRLEPIQERAQYLLAADAAVTLAVKLMKFVQSVDATAAPTKEPIDG